MTGRKSDELERCKYPSPQFSKQTTELIEGKPVTEIENADSGAFWSHPATKGKSRPFGRLSNPVK
jgi:hypothetical protein